MSVIFENTVLERERLAKTKADDRTGSSYPMCVTVVPGGVNFSIF
jgi:hypothetical protein